MHYHRYLKWDLVFIYVKLRVQPFLWKKMDVWSGNNLTIIPMGQREYFAEGRQLWCVWEPTEVRRTERDGVGMLRADTTHQQLHWFFTLPDLGYMLEISVQLAVENKLTTLSHNSPPPFFFSRYPAEMMSTSMKCPLKFGIQIWTIMKNIEACFP